MCQLAEFLFGVAASLVSRPGEASTSVKGYGGGQRKKRESREIHALGSTSSSKAHLPPPHFYHSAVQ